MTYGVRLGGATLLGYLAAGLLVYLSLPVAQA